MTNGVNVNTIKNITGESPENIFIMKVLKPVKAIGYPFVMGYYCWDFRVTADEQRARRNFSFVRRRN
jgi:hypothetical protein